VVVVDPALAVHSNEAAEEPLPRHAWPALGFLWLFKSEENALLISLIRSYLFYLQIIYYCCFGFAAMSTNCRSASFLAPNRAYRQLFFVPGLKGEALRWREYPRCDDTDSPLVRTMSDKSPNPPVLAVGPVGAVGLCLVVSFFSHCHFHPF
jgi:hypothetical protein